MAAKMWTVGEMVDWIIEKLRQSAAIQTNRQSVLLLLQEALDYYIAYGRQIGDSGWVWLLDTASVPVAAGASTVALTALAGGVPMSVKNSAGGSYPIAMMEFDPQKFRNFTYNPAATGEPQVFGIESYDHTTDVWTMRLWPVPSAAITLQILYQKQSVELTDGYDSAKQIMCPPHLRWGLMKHAIAQGFQGSDRRGRYQIAIAERDEWLELARQEVAVRKGGAQIVVDSQKNYLMGNGASGSDQHFWGWV